MRRAGRRMRILMTVDTVGGVWTYAMELAAAMAPHGVEYVIATMGREPSAEQMARARALPNVRLAVSSFKLEWMTEPWGDVDAAGWWLLGLAEREGVDLVHLNGYAHGALDFGAPIMVVAHSCVMSWWRAVKGEEAPPSVWGEYRERVCAGLEGADAVVAPTRAMLCCLERHYGRRTTGRVIPNGRGAETVRPAPKEPSILAAGRVWDAAKNVAALGRVAPSLPWPCLVAGDSWCADAGEVADGGAGVGVGFGQGIVPLGRLSAAEMADRLSRASIFAHPARYEPFGLAVLEAGLAGCALVLGDIDSLREVWGDAAVYVAPDDDAGLRAALMGLIEDPALRGRAGAAAKERAGVYTGQRMGEAYAALYGDLVGNAKERPRVRRPVAALDE